MKKQKPITINVEPTLSERINDHPAIEWAAENRNNLIWILVFTLALGIFAYRTVSSWSQQTGQNYLSAESAYLEMRSTTGERSNQAADKLTTLIQQQPDLQAKYDGLLSQFLLIRGNNAEATSLAQRALSRTAEENSPYFQQYAHATLQIAAGDYAGALTESLKLQELIVANSDITHSTLLPTNLLRIAMLQQKLGLDDEINSWQQFKDLASEQGKAVHFEKVADIYREGDINLDVYIAHRLNVLK
jgi:hypothetical protein